MKLNKCLCVLLSVVALAAVGCDKEEEKNSLIIYDNESVEDTTYEEVKTFYGESATYGDMTVTVTKMEDPNIVMEKNDTMAVFFYVTIENGTSETVTTNYLNNFALTVDGTFYDSSKCFTIPVMKELYDFHGEEAIQQELPAGETVSGYLAAEVDPNFQDLQLHYIPKTTDQGSRVTVDLTRDNMEYVKK